MIAADRDAGGMNLRVTRIGEGRALLVGPPGGGDVAALGVGGKIKNIAVAAGGQNHRVGRVGGNGPRDQVARDDAFGMAVDHDQVQHFRARKHFHFAQRQFAGQSAW